MNDPIALDKALIAELAAAEADARDLGNAEGALALRAAGYLAKLRDASGLAVIGALLGSVSLVLYPRQRGTLGPLVTAAGAIVRRFDAFPMPIVERVTLDQTLTALGRVAVARDELEREVAALRDELAKERAARARAERAASHAAELAPTLPSGPAPASPRAPPPPSPRAS